MASATSRPRKTVSDLLALPQGTRAELIDGEIRIMTPSPIDRHQAATLNLAVHLHEWAFRERAGRVYVAPFDVHLPSGDVVEPDVLFISTVRMGIVRKWVYGAPDLLIEVLSASDPERDRVVKRDLYARNGVPEYWIVDPEREAIDVLSLSGSAYAAAHRFSPGEILTSARLAGFALPVEAVFA